VTIIARFDEDGKGMTRHGLAVHRLTAIIARTSQVTINAAKIGLAVSGMGLVICLILMTGGAKGIGRHGSACLLGVNLMAVNTLYPNGTVTARLPFMQRTGMAAAAQFGRGGNGHALLRMFSPVWTVASFARYPGQNKLTGYGIIPGGVAGETFAWSFHLL
jgi:hypothetical protein